MLRSNRCAQSPDVQAKSRRGWWASCDCSSRPHSADTAGGGKARFLPSDSLQPFVDAGAVEAWLVGKLRLFLEWLTVPMLLVALQLPHASLCYWLSSGLATLGQHYALKLPAVRSALALSMEILLHAAARPGRVASEAFTWRALQRECNEWQSAAPAVFFDAEYDMHLIYCRTAAGLNPPAAAPTDRGRLLNQQPAAGSRAAPSAEVSAEATAVATGTTNIGALFQKVSLHVEA